MAATANDGCGEKGVEFPCPFPLGVCGEQQDSDLYAEVPSKLCAKEIINAIGFGPFQRRLWLLCSLGICADGLEKAAMMYIIQAAGKEWNVHGIVLGLLGAASGLGQAVGSILFGRWSDSRGRRSALQCSITLVFVTGLLSAVAPNYVSFVILRCIINMGLGGFLPVAFTLFSEFLPCKSRSRWLPFLYAAFGAGRLFTSLLAWAASEVSWRFYMVAIALPSGLVWLLFRGILETPNYLISRGRIMEARIVFDAVAAQNGSKSPLGPSAVLCPEEGFHTSGAFSCSIFNKRSSKLLCVSWILISFGIEWFNWLLKILLASGVSQQVAYVGLVLFNSNELVAPLLVSLLPTSFMLGRPRTLISGVAISAFAALCAFAVEVSIKGSSFTMIATCVWASYSGVSLFVINYAITPEYFPSEVRGTGFGMCMMCNRLGYIIGPLLAAGPAESAKVHLILGCASCYLLILVLALFLDAPETPSLELEAERLACEH